MIKKLFALILCLSLMLSLTAGAFAEEKKTINYVSLGASQTWGHGAWNPYPEQFSNWTGTADQLEAWEQYGIDADAWNPYELRETASPESGYNTFGVDVISTNSFPWMVKTEIENQGYNVNFSQLAVSGFKSSHARTFLNNEYNGAGVIDRISRVVTQMGDVDIPVFIENMREKYQTAVKNADLITFDYGANEIIAGLVETIGPWASNFEDFSSDDPDYEAILDPADYEKFKEIREMLITKTYELTDALGIDRETAQPILSLLDKFAFGLLTYCTSLDDVMGIIYDCNPDVCVVVLQIQNTLSDQTVLIGDVEFPAGEILQIATDFLNTYASSFSKYCSKYYYAKITDNRRVELNLDLIKNYSGPEDMSDFFIDMLDVMDMDFDIHIKAQLTPEYENAGGTVGDNNYEDALFASHDAFLQLLSYIFNSYTCSLSSLSGGSVENVIPVINTMLGEVSDAFINGNGDYAQAIENAKENFSELSSDDQGAISTFLKAMGWNTSIIHPSLEGHKEMGEAVINALKTNNTGIKSILSGMDYSARSFKKSVDSIKDCIDELEGKVEEDPIGFITSIIPAETITDKIETSVSGWVKKAVSINADKSKFPIVMFK